MRIQNPVRLAIASCLLTLIPLSVTAQFAKKEDAIKYRQSAFALMSAHMGRIGAVVKGGELFRQFGDLFNDARDHG